MVEIKRTDRYEDAYEIAKALSEYFNEGGLKLIKESVKNEVLYGAFEGDKMIGFTTYKILNPEAIELSFIGILPDYRGKGTGSFFVQETLKEIGSGYKVCEVKTLAETVEDENYARTRNFWRKQGFIPIEIIDPYPGWDPGNPCQILVRLL